MAGQTAPEDLGLILKGSPFESDQAAHADQAKDPDRAVSSGKTQKHVAEIDTEQNAPSQEKDALAASKTKSPTSTKPKSLTDTSKHAPVKGPATKQIGPIPVEKSPVSPQSPQSAKVNTTHPAASIKGIRGGPAKIMAVMESANKARIEREKKSPVEAKHSQPKKDMPKAPTTNNLKKDPTSPRLEKAPKPVIQSSKLPATATAPTVVSVGRTDGPPKSLSTDNRQVHAVRKDKQPPKATSNPTTSTLAKRTPRNSLAPQTNGHERPKSRVSTAKDESFLARMMRPTASSQQKVHEKVAKAESPPRVSKVSDRVRQSLGPTKRNNDKENEEGAPLEATKSIPEVEEQKTEMQGETAVAQEDT